MPEPVTVTQLNTRVRELLTASPQVRDQWVSGEISNLKRYPSGHYYFKENYVAESQGLAMIKLANLICRKKKPVSELVAPLRKYFSSGEINSKVADVKPILERIRTKYSDGHMFELDGISVEYSNWWFNVRSSNTEPLLRLIVEAKDKETMEEKRDELLKIIRG